MLVHRNLPIAHNTPTRITASKVNTKTLVSECMLLINELFITNTFYTEIPASITNTLYTAPNPTINNPFMKKMN